MILAAVLVLVLVAPAAYLMLLLGVPRIVRSIVCFVVSFYLGSRVARWWIRQQSQDGT